MSGLLHLDSDEGPAAQPRPFLGVPNVTVHPSVASVPPSLWRYNYLCTLKRLTGLNISIMAHRHSPRFFVWRDLIHFLVLHFVISIQFWSQLSFQCWWPGRSVTLSFCHVRFARIQLTTMRSCCGPVQLPPLIIIVVVRGSNVFVVFFRSLMRRLA